MTAVEIILYAAVGYLALGVLLGPASLLWIGPKRDPALRGSPRRVLLILLPGSVAVWPMLLGVWMQRTTGEERA